MAKKKHLSVDNMVGDDVMAPARSPSAPSGAPVTQNLSQTHQRAKEKIETLEARLDEEREGRLKEVSELQQKLDRLNHSGGNPDQIEEAVEQARRASEEREKALLADIDAAREQVLVLEKQLEDVPEDGVYEIDPKRVRRSKFANRNLLAFSDKAFDQLRASIKKHRGNDVAAKVRPVSDDPDFDYEVVYGHRRHQATLLEGMPFYAKIDDIPDAELVQLMHIENQREDLSPFEEAFQFKQWLDEGFYEDATTLAADIEESKSFVSQRMAIVALPKIIFNALKDPRQLGITGWRELCAAYRNNSDSIIQASSLLASEDDDLQPADKAEVVKNFRKLMSGDKPRAIKAEVKAVTLPSGTPLFKAERKANGYVIKFDNKGVADDIQQEALQELEYFLKKRLSK